MEFEISSAISISEAAKFSPAKLSGSSLPSSVNPEELARKFGIVVGLSLSMVSNSSKQGGFLEGAAPVVFRLLSKYVL